MNNTLALEVQFNKNIDTKIQFVLFNKVNAVNNFECLT